MTRGYAQLMDDLKPTMKTILIIEDDPLQIDLLIQMLHEYRVVNFATGHAALSFLDTGPVDLILLDYVLAGRQDGIETLLIIKSVRELSSLPVIFISSNEAAGVRAKALGAAQYLRKPYSPRFLIGEIERLTK